MSVAVLKTSLRFERPPEGVRTDQLSTITAASAIGAPDAESTTVPACAWRTTSYDATHAEAVTAKAAMSRSVQLFKTTLPQAFVSPTSAQRHASAARQTGDKFAHANLMTDWWVGCMRLLGGDVQEPYTDRPTLCR